MEAERNKLSIVQDICGQFGLTALTTQITACKNLLSENAAVNVAVLGKFKAGKSSFLNSLSGVNILPTGAVPVTAVITELFWAPQKTITVKFLNGESKAVLAAEIAGYASEELNPGNRKSAASIKIGLPSLAEYRGVCFVDTPGLDSAHRHNTETSLDWLPNTGLALITISADAPLSEQDIELIEKARHHSPRIVILLTKADRLAAAEIGQVLDFVRQKINDRFGKDLPVYPFSIKDGFADLREDFARKALMPLSRDIGTERAGIFSHKITSLESQCRDYLLAARAAAGKAAQEREQLKALALQHKTRLKSLKSDFSAIFARMSESTRQEIEKTILAHKGPAEKELKETLSIKFNGHSPNLLQMTRTYNSELERFFSDKTASIFEKEKARLEKLADDCTRAFATKADDFSARLSMETEKALGVILPQIRIEFPQGKIPAPDIRISQAFDSHLELLWFLIPTWIFRNALRRHFIGLIPFENEKNLTRLAMRLAESLNAKTKRAMDIALEHSKTIQDTVEKALLTSPESLSEIETALRTLSH